MYDFCKDIISVNESKVKIFLFFLNYYIINIGIQKCFDNINHPVVLKKSPLCKKYCFFMKAWLKAPIYDFFTWKIKISVKEKLKSGVPQSFIIGRNYQKNFSKVMNVLVKKLKLKGLEIKNRNNSNFLFKPGVSFDYLGFRFIYTNFKSKKLHKEKYTANKYIDLRSPIKN